MDECSVHPLASGKARFCRTCGGRMGPITIAVREFDRMTGVLTEREDIWWDCVPGSLGVEGRHASPDRLYSITLKY